MNPQLWQSNWRDRGREELSNEDVPEKITYLLNQRPLEHVPDAFRVNDSGECMYTEWTGNISLKCQAHVRPWLWPMVDTRGGTYTHIPV